MECFKHGMLTYTVLFNPEKHLADSHTITTEDYVKVVCHCPNIISMTITSLCCIVITGVEKIVFSLPLPIKNESEILNSLEKAIDLNPGVRIAIIDHITSSTAIRMPVKKMIEICHRQYIPVLVDGAHCPGQIDLDLESLGADYYTGW